MRACVCVFVLTTPLLFLFCQRCHTRLRQSPQLPWNQDWVCWPSSPPRRCRRRRRRRSLAPSVRATTAPGTRVSGTPTLLEPARGIHLSTRDEVSTVGMGWSTDGCHPCIPALSYISVSVCFCLSPFSSPLLTLSLSLSVSRSLFLPLSCPRTHARTHARAHARTDTNTIITAVELNVCKGDLDWNSTSQSVKLKVVSPGSLWIA